MLLSCLVLAFACPDLADQEKAAPAAAAPASAYSEEAVRAWAAKVEAALRDGEPAQFADLFSTAGAVDRALAGIDRRNPAYASQILGTVIQARKGDGLYGILRNAYDFGGTVELLRLRGTAEAPTALFRIVREPASLDYVEFVMGQHPKRGLVAVDAYVASNGQHISEILRRAMIVSAIGQDAKLREALPASEQLVREQHEVLVPLVAADLADEDARVVEMLAALPAACAGDRTLIAMRIRVHDLGDPRYFAAIEDLRKHYPSDLGTHVQSIDAFWVQKRHADAFAEIEKIRALVGGDPYVDYMRAQLLQVLGEHDQALAAAARAIEGGLGWYGPWWTQIAIHVGNERFDRAVEVMREMDSRFDVEWPDYAKTEGYEAFAASAPYAAWLAERKAKAPAPSGG